jgi:tRNA dimethylallyltransferase
MATLILTGPTASGKTSLALEIAESVGNIEIINADSVVVYRHFDIGTAKPTREEQARIPHHLVDVREPFEAFTAGDFVRETHARIQKIEDRGRRALIVGGTGFYLKALLFGLWDAPSADLALRARLEATPLAELHTILVSRDPESAYRIGPADRYRLVRACEILELTGKTPSELERDRPREPDPSFSLFVIDRETAELEDRIQARTEKMLQEGLVEETRSLLERFPGSRPLGSVGYAETVAYLEGREPQGRKIPAGIEGLRQEINLSTRQLVKKQRTWFRSAPGARHFVLARDLATVREELFTFYGHN